MINYSENTLHSEFGGRGDCGLGLGKFCKNIVNSKDSLERR